MTDFMDFGQVVRIIEIMVTVYCGAGIIVRPYKMRKNNGWTRAAFLLCLTLCAVSAIANSFLFRFSGIEHLLYCIYDILLFSIFYKIPFLVNIVETGLYWVNLSFVKIFFLMVSSAQDGVSMNYILAEADSWHPIMIIGMIFTIIVIICFFIWRSKGETSRIVKYNKNYIALFIFVILEWIISSVSFGDNKFNMKADIGLLLDNVYLLAVVIATVIFVIIISAYEKMAIQRQMITYQNQMMKKQYELINVRYETERQQIHDIKNYLAPLQQYLINGMNDEALQYLRSIDDKLEIKKHHPYCGLREIDFMLDYKIEDALKYGITIKPELSLTFCPLQDIDISLIMGNLIDNAIEAVKYLSVGERHIGVYISTENNIFLLEIMNPYRGKRQVKAGKYMTTKLDKATHGIGLRSVETVVTKNGGSILIDDSNGYFKVSVILYGSEIKNNA